MSRSKDYRPNMAQILGALEDGPMTVREIAELFGTENRGGIYATLCEAKAQRKAEVVFREKYVPEWRLAA